MDELSHLFMPDTLPPLTPEQYQQIEEEFAVMFGSLVEPVAAFDPGRHGRPLVTCNNAFSVTCGLPKEQLAGKLMASIVDFDVQHVPQDAWDDAPIVEALRLHNSPLIEGSRRYVDGRLYLIEYSERLVTIADRELIIEIDHNVREAGRIDVHNAGIQNIPGFYSLMSGANFGAVLVDPHTPNYTVVDCNGEYARMLGYSPKELINQPVSNFSAKDGEKKYQNWLQNESRKYFQELEELGPKSFIGSMQRKDGTFIDIAYNGWAVSVGGRNYILNLIRDVSHNAIQRACDNIRSEVLTLVMGATPLTECLRSIIMSLESNIPERYAAVLLNTNGKIQHIIAPSLRPEYSTFITQQRNAQTQDSLHQSASNQKTVIIENVSATEYEQSEEHISAALTDARSCWILPLFSSTHDLLGLLTLYSTQTGRPQSGEIELLQNASNLLALTIEHRQITEKLAHQAEHDALTNLPNRLLFQDRLQQAITSAQRRGEQVAVLFLDLDGFKHVNDTLGHAGGDILLQQVARRLEKSMRRSDTVARVGGDEFTVMLPDVKHPDDTVIIAQKIIDAIKEPFDILAHEIYVTTSVGIAVYPQDSNDTNELQRQADAAMYKAKNCGKNCYAFFEEAIGQELQERLELKTQLRRAFENREFELYYQPQINLASGHVVSLEALIRWRHPKLGMVLPLSFIPAAEESGIILKIGAWVVDEACRQLALWRQDEIHMNRITVNISALQFGQQEFFQIIKKTLETHNIQPQYLELEITESVMVRNIEESVRQMTRLKNLGVSIALDDFGTGYSSLSYLQKLPVSTLKIDRSFVQGIETRNETQLLVQAVVTLATGLGLTVTAEGIETEAELKTLKQLGCHLAQGYYLAEPMHASGTARFLQNYVMSKSLQLPSASR